MNETPNHYVRHILRPGDYVRTEYRCTAPEGAECRMSCARCHQAGEEVCVCESAEPERVPDMQDVGCMIIPWLTDGASEECFNGDEQPVRGPDWQPITPEWNGDNYSWDYAT